MELRYPFSTCQDKDFAKDITAALDETKEKQKAAIRKQMEGFRIELETLRAERANAVKLFASGKIGESAYNSFVVDIDEREDHFVNELERLNCAISDAGMTAVKRVFELAIKAKDSGNPWVVRQGSTTSKKYVRTQLWIR